jgi:hypothetical protein
LIIWVTKSSESTKKCISRGIISCNDEGYFVKFFFTEVIKFYWLMLLLYPGELYRLLWASSLEFCSKTYDFLLYNTKENRCTTLCDKVCQWLVTGRWGSPVSSINKTDCHDITEILLKVAINNIKQTYYTAIILIQWELSLMTGDHTFSFVLYNRKSYVLLQNSKILGLQ